MRVETNYRPLQLHVGIVTEMKNTRALLRHVVDCHGGWQVAWEAHDGGEAVRLCTQDTPDLILMDLIMQGKNGVKAIREIMAATPCYILIVTDGVDKNAALVFEALAAGAVDAVDTPADLTEVGQNGLNAKIQTIAKLAGRTGRYRKSMSKAPIAISGLPTLVAIGASAGGPAALRQLLEQLPVGFPAAVVIVQHLDKEYAGGMSAWLSSVSHLPVTVARSGERPEAGRILLAATNDHLVLQEDGTLVYTAEPTDQPYRPSVDEFFASVALNWTGPIVGVILTGMGQDGARGLLALRRLGHLTLAQDRESSIVYGMPGAAVRFGAAMAQMNPVEIGKELVRILSAQQTTLQTNQRGKDGRHDPASRR